MGTEMRPRSESRLPPLLSLIAGMVDLIVFLALSRKPTGLTRALV
jgi:uncharacterized membrane protein YoaK (UPF0700 family)